MGVDIRICRRPTLVRVNVPFTVRQRSVKISKYIIGGKSHTLVCVAFW